MKVIILLVLSILSFQVYAQDRYVCHKDGAERTVEVVYSQPGSKVPCEVKYTKPDSNKILWSANHEVGYCETKAKQFVLKLGGFGWSCSDVNDKAAQPLGE
ncbi:hypothetical protein C0W59_09740 [Photobacterium kishitanii]|uniref:hypothetical protein n=1 Tax=Photobacterium kishitanii TaxID=318456 RepID=UPI000D15341E|nr:hypothetical protein [Photobacterium kishitanii]PSV15868.1 hypothetical protein C0W59_09740 [Photobacterium kishitanii]